MIESFANSNKVSQPPDTKSTQDQYNTSLTTYVTPYSKSYGRPPTPPIWHFAYFFFLLSASAKAAFNTLSTGFMDIRS